MEVSPVEPRLKLIAGEFLIVVTTCGPFETKMQICFAFVFRDAG